MTPRLPIALLALALTQAIAGAERDPQQVLTAAKAQAVTIPKQAEALVRLAWPSDGSRDPEVQALARQELLDFGAHAMPALREAIRTVPPLYQADATATLISARRSLVSGTHPDYLPGLEEAVWSGSVEAQRLAMTEVARYRYPPAMLSIVDAAVAHPELLPTAIHALAVTRDVRARIFLGEVLASGAPEDRTLAAQALAAIGDLALETLRDATRSEDAGVRRAALEALLPISAMDDLTLLEAYAAQHPGDDAQLLERVQERARNLKTQFDRQLDAVPEPGLDR